MTVIDNILNEWSFRCHDGIVDMNDPTKAKILFEILKPLLKEDIDDDILNTLKRTSDARIKVANGQAEIMRIFGKNKENLQFFNGLDQQLARLGANSDFIDWVGGIDDAIRNKLIKVAKDGKVSLLALGEAAKKAFDLKQISSFVTNSIAAAKAASDQRTAFLRLTKSGISAAEATKITSDASLASAIANTTNKEKIDGIVKAQREQTKQEEITRAMTDPKEYMSDVNDELQRQYDLQQKLMGLQKDAVEAKIRGDYIGAAMIGQDQMKTQFESNKNANPVDINAKLGVMAEAKKAAGTSKAADAIKSTLGQYSANINNLRGINPSVPGGATARMGNFGYAAPNQSFGQTQSNGVVYNITTNVNVDNADAKAIADLATKQTIAQIKLINDKNNKSNAVVK